MILRELVLHNFGPYRGRTVIDLSPQRPSTPRPIILIGALNGSGKTTLLDAIQLALYGTRARCSTRKTLSYAEFLRQSINTRSAPADGAAVSLEFDYATSRGTSRLRVLRSWRVAGKSVSEEARVFLDGEEDPDLSETWAERVEDILPIGISNLFFFDGEQVRGLASSSQSTPEVHTAIRTLLGLELPQRLQTDLGLVMGRRQKKVVKSQVSAVQLDELEARARQTERMRQDLVYQVAEVQGRLERAQLTLMSVQQHFMSEGGELAERRPVIEDEIRTLKLRQEHTRDRVRELAAGALPLGLAADLLRRAIKRGKDERDHQDAHHLSGLFEERDEALLTFLTRRGTDPSLLDALRHHLAAERSERRRPMTPPPFLGVTREALLTAEAAYEEARVAHLSALDARTALVHLETQRTRLEARLQAAAPPEELAAQLSRLNDAQREVVRLEHEVEVLREERDRLAKEAAQHRSEHQKLLRRMVESEFEEEEDVRVLRSAERVVSVMEDFKRRLLYRKLHKLEQLIAERFSHLARKQDFIQRAIVDPDTFELRLFDSDGLPVIRDRMSAGEQQLLAISFLWALALASGRNLPVVIDTPLGRMDHDHRHTLVERYFPHASHQVILLSTDAEIDDRYRTVLELKGAIDREYTLRFDPKLRQSHVESGYFV